MKDPNLTYIDPLKIDFSLDVRHLSREIILTVKVLDDPLFTRLYQDIETLYNEAIKEFNQVRDDLKNQKL